ncbi:ABC transporter permease [Sinomicrobium weinanense]|uniref:ABC transporter permease n=1 Tax=Sinomicrobium weinanense TaxID=2842200 RepID=A0A926Q308_9FLAO|nr:ABC transporter permease [Sinomicrobium weinanense]MBC9795250.1 ABC transporter permease [Sinomicrobium weinanense]MBU3125722.1 ABC transporter permease [Sinomicrobium weinanense]
MFDLDKWEEIYHTIKKHKLRTFLTAFGVFWGILMLVLLLGAGSGLENGVLQMFSGMARNTLYVWSESTSLPYQGFPKGRSIQFNNEDYRLLKSEVQEIKYLAPNLFYGPVNVNYREQNNEFTLKGTHPDLWHINPIIMTGGRFFNVVDYEESRKVAVIGSRVKKLNFGDDDPIGKYIEIDDIFFQVVGVFDTEGGGSNRRSYAESIYVPVTTLQKGFGLKDHISDFALSPVSGVSAVEIEKEIRQFLSGRHQIHPDDEKAIGALNTGSELRKFTSLFAGINFFIWLVGIGTIIAGIVGVGNIMMIIVKERTREIGVRKALGATPRSVVSLIILESVVITGVSGYFGLVVGVALVEGLSYLLITYNVQSEFFAHPEINMRVAFIAIGVLVIAGVLAGLIPAINAARVRPIEALRVE